MWENIILIVLLFVVTFCYPRETVISRKLSVLTRKRILKELRDVITSRLSLDCAFNNTDKYENGIRLSPIKGNLLEWHFTFTGVEGSVYEGGLYHGFILLDPQYPNRAPSIALLTPSGRWEVLKPICLSASSYHQETWDSNWTLRTLVMSLRNFMTTKPTEIGGITASPDERRQLANRSKSYFCSKCGVSHYMLSTSNAVLTNQMSIISTLDDLTKMENRQTMKRKSQSSKVTFQGKSLRQIFYTHSYDLKLKRHIRSIILLLLASCVGIYIMWPS